MSLYAHQQQGLSWLLQRESAGLFWEMGVGKSRTALEAAKKLFDAPTNARRKIDRVLVLCPASVQFAWREELQKLDAEGFNYNLLRYDARKLTFFVERVGGNLNGEPQQHMPIAIVSYALLQQKRHAEAVERFARAGSCALIADESSFLKNRTAKQTKGAYAIACSSSRRWLLSGTPVCNSPLDLYAQGKVMAPNGSSGPLKGIDNYYQFQAMFGDMLPVMGGNGKPLMRYGRGRGGRMGMQPIKQWRADESKLVGLQKRFAPYVSRVEKKDCLDLPPKSYTVREVTLSDETWRIYQELKREAMLVLPDNEARPEPNAAVRILRLCQITSGHAGCVQEMNGPEEVAQPHDISSEKLDYLADAILSGELVNERALIVWCRWRRERERLGALLRNRRFPNVCDLYGGQSQDRREDAIGLFMAPMTERVVLLAQPHAGGFGLNLTAASTAVYLSNDWSYSTRVQSEDRCHRIGQRNAVTYIDVVAVGPKGQRTVDHAVLEALRAKQNIAEWTTSAWRKALEE